MVQWREWRWRHMDDGTGVPVGERAGFWARLAAYVIDGIIVATTCYALYFVPGFLYFAAIGQLGSNEPAPLAMAVVIFALCVIAGVGYPVCFWRWRGQTPGKMALGIRVVRSDGSPPGWGAALLRFLGYVLAWVTADLLFLWIPVDRQGRGIHDRIAGTYVVKAPRKRSQLTEAYERV